MKRHIFVYIALLAFSIGKSQENWPPIGAKWYYAYTPCSGKKANCDIEEYITIEVTKDTSINDTTCKVLAVMYHKEDNTIINIGNEYIFSTEDKVYNYHHKQFNLLYDFSAEIGDTIDLVISTNTKVHQKLFAFANDSIIVQHIVVDKGIESINGTNTEFIQFEIIRDEQNHEGYIHLGENKIIKGVGDLTFLFGEFTIMLDEYDIYGPLRCYTDGAVDYNIGIACDTIKPRWSTIGLNKSLHNINAYPNPANNFLTIDFTNENCQAINVEIFNSSGKLVHSEQTNDKQIVVSVNELNAGLYFFKLSSATEIIGGGKFVK